jgi:hypothetical protein
MVRRKKWRNWGDHPIVVIVGTVAGIAAIVALALGVVEQLRSRPNAPLETGPNPAGDLGVMAEIIRIHLLPGGKLARSSLQMPSLPDEEYRRAFDTVRQTATPQLRALFQDRASVNVVLNFDRIMRNYLNEDGTTMSRGVDPAPGTLTVEQYIKSGNVFVASLTPSLRTAMNNPDQSSLDQLERTIRGQPGEAQPSVQQRTSPVTGTPRDILCQLASVIQAMTSPVLGGAGKDITPEIKSYSESAPYEGVTDAQARQLFRDAFEATRKAVQTTDDFQKGERLGAAQMAVLKTCSYYALDECAEFTRGARDAGEYIRAISLGMNRLAQCAQ